MERRQYRLNNGQAFTRLFLTNIRELVRDPLSFFLTLAFPFLFIALFGLMSASQEEPSLRVGIVPTTEAADVMDRLKSGLESRKNVSWQNISAEAIANSIETGEVDAAVSYAPAGKGTIELYFPRGNEAAGQFLKSVVTESSLPLDSPGIGLQPVGDKEPGMFAYILPGIIVMAFSSLALFGTSTPIIQMRQRGTLRLIGLTQVSRLTFIASQLSARFLIAVIQLAVLLGVAASQGLLPGENLLAILIVNVLGILMLFALGYLVGGVGKSLEAVSGLLGGFMGPVLIVSGLLMPIDYLPSWVKLFSAAIPLTYYGEALRYYMIGIPPSMPIMIHYAVMAGTTVLFGFLAMKTFRWDQHDTRKRSEKHAMVQAKRGEVKA